MSDYPSWSDERDSYTDANWSAPPAAPSHYGGGGGGGGYPGADYPAPEPYRGGGGGYGGYENRGSAGYGSAGGGSYGGGGGGGGYASSNSSYVPAKPVGAAKSSEISFDTSSRDPAHLRSRVFIGCLGQSGVVCEDIIELCRPFGGLMAVTLFKQGYAFVQFDHAEDADNACEVLNGKRWKGVNIDRSEERTEAEAVVAEEWPGGGGGGGGGGGSGGAGGYGGGGGSSNVNDYQGSVTAMKTVKQGNIGDRIKDIVDAFSNRKELGMSSVNDAWGIAIRNITESYKRLPQSTNDALERAFCFRTTLRILDGDDLYAPYIEIVKKGMSL